jgi:hypothetical protein
MPVRLMDELLEKACDDAVFVATLLLENHAFRSANVGLILARHLTQLELST